MRFSELNLLNSRLDENYTCLKSCKQFLRESGGLPLLKYLPKTYDDVARVKVRLKKRSDKFGKTFNEAFEEKRNALRQRAIFGYGEDALLSESSDKEPFYIFPSDGYKFIFCKEVANSEKEVRETFTSLCEAFDEEENAKELVKDLLQMSYTEENLQEGIETGAEIVIYGIPFYYAVRKSSVDSYENLIGELNV